MEPSQLNAQIEVKQRYILNFSDTRVYLEWPSLTYNDQTTISVSTEASYERIDLLGLNLVILIELI